eukprot:c21488_g1_i1 orf=238-615(+)
MATSFAWVWASAAGAAASLSAVLAKLVSSQERWQFRLAAYVGVVLLNVIMWSLYVRSLRVLTSLQATVINFASNFLLSGFAGFIFFGEALHFRWFVGGFFILCGIFILSKRDKHLEDCSKKGKQM